MPSVMEPLPPDLDQQLQGMALANEGLLYARDYPGALAGFKSMYTLLLEKQPPDNRYHKGYPLHQIGITLFLSGKQDKALKYFILAFIEDLLSKEEGQEDKADDEPASKTLKGAYGIPEVFLAEFKRIVRTKKSRKELVRNPDVIYEEVASGKPPQQVLQSEEAPDIGQEERDPGKFESDWEKRVFVGGNYATHISELKKIKRICLDKGYDPVLAKEFKFPPGKIHHHSLMLLHECDKAIFEVSSEAGQLMEIERLRDYEIKPLIICQDGAHLSKMLEELVSAQDYDIKRYGDDDKLVNLVEDYLH
jgi:hypothetical protein